MKPSDNVIKFPRIISGTPPPHDLDIEAVVLSAALLDAGACDTVLSVVGARSFYSTANRLICQAIEELHHAGRSVDVATVAAQLRAHHQLEAVGGPQYLAQLVDATPAVAHVEDHARVVVDLARRRAVIVLAQEVASEGYGDVPDDWLASVEARLSEATGTGYRSEVRPLGQVLEAWWRSLVQPELAPPMLKTGLSAYDHVVGGLRGGDLLVVAARPGMGKSALMQCWARRIAEQGETALLFSLEMPTEQVAQRFVSQRTGIPLSAVRNGDVREEDRRGWLTTATLELAKLPIMIDDTAGIQLAELRSKARRVAALSRQKGRKLGTVMVDYLQIMGSVGGRSREEEVSAMSRGLKQLARELNIPVVACAQLNRQVDGRSDKRPTLSDLRESGAIEQDSDQVLFIYREGYYQASRRQDLAELIVAKNRNGPTGTVEIGWLGDCTRFCDVEELP
jgi:replicative DNA helicase